MFDVEPRRIVSSARRFEMARRQSCAMGILLIENVIVFSMKDIFVKNYFRPVIAV